MKGLTEAVRIRKVAVGDERFVLQVRNTEDVRRASFQTRKICKGEHRSWFQSALGGRTVHFYIIETVRGRKQGTLRLTPTGPERAEIHISLLPEARGRGVGTSSICELFQILGKAKGGPQIIEAHIKERNQGSLSFFRRLGFRRPQDSEKNCSHPSCVRLIFRRRRFLIWVDLGPSIGMGHIMREKTLSDYLRSCGHQTYFYTTASRGSIMQLSRHSRNGMFPNRWLSAREVRKWIADDEIDCLIIDALRCPTGDIISRVRERRIPVAIVGNYVQVPRWVDLCVNPYTRPEFSSAKTRRLLSPAYSIISPEFSSNGPVKRLLGRRPKILILAGGGDTRGMIFRVIESLAALSSSCQLIVVTGHCFTKESWLRRVRTRTEPSIRFYSKLCPAKVAHLMRISDIAVISFGRTIDEVRSFGLPAFVLTSSALNALGARQAEGMGGVIYLGDFRRVSPNDFRRRVTELIRDERRWKELSRCGRRLVDGQGVKRVARGLEALVGNS